MHMGRMRLVRKLVWLETGRTRNPVPIHPVSHETSYILASDPIAVLRALDQMARNCSSRNVDLE